MMNFEIYQLKSGPEARGLLFRNFDEIGGMPERANYVKVYEGSGEDLDAEKIFCLFQHDNPSCPEDFKGHSLSVSDVISMRQQGRHPVLLYCNRMGFKLMRWEIEKEDIGKIRYTTGDLLDSVYDLCIALGMADSWTGIQDYYLSKDTGRLISDVSFDLIPEIRYGNSEGAYIDVRLSGYIDAGESTEINIGTFKTLETSPSALMAAGRLVGSLVWACREFTGVNYHYFLSDREIKEMRGEAHAV